MAFSFYQSLTTTPNDPLECTRSFQLTAWQRFWRLEVPFAMPGLVWNMMLSMSGGWFFRRRLRGDHAGRQQLKLPGSAAMSRWALDKRDMGAVFAAIGAMLVVILLYDHLLFRPLVACRPSSASRSWPGRPARILGCSSCCGGRGCCGWWARRWARFWARWGGCASRCRWAWPARRRAGQPRGRHRVPRRGGGDRGVRGVADHRLHRVEPYRLGRSGRDGGAGLHHPARVVVMIILATLLWVPIGVWIGLRPNLARRIQVVAQFVAAFPANLLFPIFVIAIVYFHASADIWLTPLMIMGTQWYILFNVIAGASAFPGDMQEAAQSFQVRGWLWWRKVILPGIFPYFVTGAITASGGSWNAAIVAEVASWGDTKLRAHGLGAYIADATDKGDFPRIVLGVVVMSLFVLAFNRILWRPLYAYATRRLTFWT